MTKIKDPACLVVIVIFKHSLISLQMNLQNVFIFIIQQDLRSLGNQNYANGSASEDSPSCSGFIVKVFS